MRSSAGVGITPPKVDGAAKPTSSVMIKRMFGAPGGGTTRGGQYGFDCAALTLMSPPNFGGGLGRYLPSMVVVASGEPGTSVVCCALAGANASAVEVRAKSVSAAAFMAADLPRRALVNRGVIGVMRASRAHTNRSVHQPSVRF